MDALSQLLSLGRSHVELDVRCLLDGPFAMPHDPLPPGEAAFHLVLAGTCRMRTADGRTLQLADGDQIGIGSLLMTFHRRSDRTSTETQKRLRD